MAKTKTNFLSNLVAELSRVGLSHERDYFVENLSMFVASGVDIITALNSIEEEVKSREMKQIVKQVKGDIEEGVPLSKALEDTHLFKAHAMQLIRVGEESGNLSRNLKVIAVEEAKERVFRSKVRSAMMYPAFVLTVTAIVGLAIAWFILPKLAVVFASLRLTLPLITQVLISVGIFLGKYGTVAVPVGGVVVVLIGYFVFGFPQTRFIGQWIAFHIPGIGRLLNEVELARFSYLMSSLMEAGLPVVQTLDSVADSTTVPKYRNFYRYLRDQVIEGHSFEASIASYPGNKNIIPAPMQQLIFSGERSGHLPEMFAEINKRYEEKTDTTTKDLAVILEPVLLVIVAGGVFTVAIGVILPIYNLVGGLGNQTDTTPPPPPQEQTKTVVTPIVATTTTATSTATTTVP